MSNGKTAEEIGTMSRELRILADLIDKSKGEPDDVIADEMNCIAIRTGKLAQDMTRLVKRLDRIEATKKHIRPEFAHLYR